MRLAVHPAEARDSTKRHKAKAAIESGKKQDQFFRPRHTMRVAEKWLRCKWIAAMEKLGRGSDGRSRCAERASVADEGLAAMQTVPRPRPTLHIAMLALALTGCTTTRYVNTYCVTKQQLEQLRLQKPGKIKDQLTGKADEDLKKVTGRLVRVEAWGDGLLDVLGGCVDPNK